MAMNEKEIALKDVLNQINKTYGKGAIMKMGEKGHIPIEAVSTGSISLDMALGIGGLPRGRIVEIYGPESSGKTTLALHVAAEINKLGGQAAFIDVEHALDPIYAKKIGVDIDNLLISQPNSGEEALEIAEQLIRSGALDLVIIDSVAALVPIQESQGNMEDHQMGTQARLMSKALRKITAAVSKTNTIVIFINQLRMKIGVMFGNPETTTGGNALKFYSSVRIEIRRKDSIKKGEEILGNVVKLKIVKNKVAAPFRTAEFNIMFGEGIQKTVDLINCAVSEGIVQKTGSWLSYGKERLGQGVEKARISLEDNPKLLTEIRAKIIKKLEDLKNNVKADDKEIEIVKNEDEQESED